MPSVALVTDSTSYIPAELRKQYNITVLPQILIWGSETMRDGVDIQPTEFYTRLKTSKTMPTTSQATPAAFKEVFSRLVGEGHDVLAILISSKLSGTIDSAIQAKAMMPEAPITIFDSLSSAMQMGFMVLHAGKMAEAGKSVDEITKVLEEKRGDGGVLLSPETLEFLHRGGRIGAANRFLGTALNIKPILAVKDGRVEPLERVRTRSKAIARMVEIIREQVGDRKVRIGSLHANLPEAAEDVLKLCAEKLNMADGFVSDVSPVIGTHVGPGTLALSYYVEEG